MGILSCDPNGVGSYLEKGCWVVDWLGVGLGSGTRVWGMVGLVA